MTRYGGIDIGSRTIELVVVDEAGQVCTSLQCDTGYDPLAAARTLIDAVPFDRIMATGYGRTLFEISFESRTITEIKAHARGARALFGDAATIIDIGGQDSKVIEMNESGIIAKFEMNDKCAAGTGRFFEVLTERLLGVSMDALGPLSLKSANPCTISSMCTIFAESEIISFLSEGLKKEDISMGMNLSIVRRIIAMGKAGRIMFKEPIVFSGGVANNVGVKAAFEKMLEKKVNAIENPQFTAAYGAAIAAMDKHVKERKASSA